MKKSKLLIILVILIIIAFVMLTIYKFSKPKDNTKSTDETLITVELKNKKKDIVYSDVLDKETYADNIINDNKEVNYTFYDDNKSIIGKIYIGEDKKLYVTNDNEYENIKISNLKFKSIYSDNSDYSKGLYVYLITEDNKLYYFGLLSNDMKKVELQEIPTKYKVLNFVDLSFDMDMGPSMYKIFVLADDGNIYEAFSGFRYKQNIKTLFNFIFVFDDNTMTNQLGNILEDKNGNPYKIKYAFYSKANENYFKYDSIIIVTEDNRMITLLGIDSYYYVYEDPAKVVNITFDKNYPFVYGKLNIDFGGEKVTFDAMCSSYYCINEFDNTEHNIDIDF